MNKKYTIEFDQDRDYMMSAVFHFLIEQHGEEFAKFLNDTEVGQDFMSFIDEKADKSHELGWCKNPNCKRKNGKSTTK